MLAGDAVDAEALTAARGGRGGGGSDAGAAGVVAGAAATDAAPGNLSGVPAMRCESVRRPFREATCAIGTRLRSGELAQRVARPDDVAAAARAAWGPRGVPVASVGAPPSRDPQARRR